MVRDRYHRDGESSVINDFVTHSLRYDRMIISIYYYFVIAPLAGSRVVTPSQKDKCDERYKNGSTCVSLRSLHRISPSPLT